MKTHQSNGTNQTARIRHHFHFDKQLQIPKPTPEGRVPRVPNISPAASDSSCPPIQQSIHPSPPPTTPANNSRSTQHAVPLASQERVLEPISVAPSTFREYLLRHARVPTRDTRHGSYGPFTFAGRAPLDFIVTLIDKILANTLHGKTVEIGGTSSAVDHRPSPTITTHVAAQDTRDNHPSIDTHPKRLPSPGGEGKDEGEIPPSEAAIFAPHTLKGATLTVGGGAQFGKTVLILNFQAYATFIEFINFGYYTPDQELLAKIVDTKFRPDVIDQQQWMAEMVHFSKSANASGKSVDRKNSYQVSHAGHKSFGHFCGMQKPPTTITLDAAALDEVDDIPARNMGYVDGRMTGSRLQLKFEIGTQRIAGAGQNARLKAGTFHVMMYECPNCHQSWNLEEEFPRCIRVRPTRRDEFCRRSSVESPILDSSDTSNSSDLSLSSLASHTSSTSHSSHPSPDAPANPPPSGILHQASGITPSTPDPILTAETPHNRNAVYYTACPNCATPLDRDSGRYIPKNPHRLAEAHFSIRVSQLNISAISLNEIVAAWYTALSDPSGAALAAFHCDRLAMPNAGAAQPITQAVLDQCRTLGLTEKPESPQPYEMRLGPGLFGVPPLGGRDTGPESTFSQPYEMSLRSTSASPSAPSAPPRFSPRFAGLDTGPRCWFWCDELRSEAVTACVWAELIASGIAPTRIPQLMQLLNITCLFIDAGGEPDLTKRLVLTLNGLDTYTPPNRPRTDLLHSRLGNIGKGITWDGEKAQWTGLRAAAVLFVAGEAKGIEHTIGFTQEGKIYPLIKCNRRESIQTAVNDFLTPESGVYEQIGMYGHPKLRTLPRARLPKTAIGPGVGRALMDSHLLNLRKERDPVTGEENWIDGAENHLGLAKVYARLAALSGSRPRVPVAWSKANFHQNLIGSMGMGKVNPNAW